MMGTPIEPGAMLVSAHRQGDVAVQRIGRVVDVVNSDQVRMEWITGSDYYVPLKKSTIFTKRTLVLSPTTLEAVGRL
jgi:hypothetical protein